MTELLNCPFCGGEANARIWERENGDAYAGVECTDCMADNSVAVMWFDDGKKELAEAIAAWNRRALPATDERERALREAAAKMRKRGDELAAIARRECSEDGSDAARNRAITKAATYYSAEGTILALIGEART